MARNSPDDVLGLTPGRNHYFLGAEASTRVLAAGPIHVYYSAQVLPMVLITGSTLPVGYYPPPGGPAPDETAYAFGVVPFGLEITTPVDRRVAIYAAGAGGIVFFTKPFPVPEADSRNFTVEYGGGVRVRTGKAQWVQVGYKFHHLSNAYTNLVNPGLDANVWYAGYKWGITLPR